jgi:hypothetical protein
MPCSVMATGMSVWMDTEHPLWCTLAADTLPHLNASTPLTPDRAWSPSASHSFAWQSHEFLQQRNTISIYEQCSPIYRLPLQNKNAVIMAREMCVHSCTYSVSDGDSYKYTLPAFKHIHSLSCATIFSTKKHSCHDLWHDPHNSCSFGQEIPCF